MPPIDKYIVKTLIYHFLISMAKKIWILLKIFEKNGSKRVCSEHLWSNISFHFLFSGKVLLEFPSENTPEKSRFNAYLSIKAVGLFCHDLENWLCAWHVKLHWGPSFWMREDCLDSWNKKAMGCFEAAPFVCTHNSARHLPVVLFNVFFNLDWFNLHS